MSMSTNFAIFANILFLCLSALVKVSVVVNNHSRFALEM